MFQLSFIFLNIGNIVTIIVLMSFSINSVICGISVSLSIENFPLPELYFPVSYLVSFGWIANTNFYLVFLLYS